MTTSGPADYVPNVHQPGITDLCKAEERPPSNRSIFGSSSSFAMVRSPTLPFKSMNHRRIDIANGLPSLSRW